MAEVAVLEARQLPVGERCGNCQLIAAPCYVSFPERGQCSTCTVLKTKCSFAPPEISDADLAAAIKNAELHPPSTEVEKQAELAQIQKQRRQLDYAQKRRLLLDIPPLVTTIVNERWQWVIFLFPIFGCLAPVLVILATVFAEPRPVSKERSDIDEAITRLIARETELKNVKIPTKEMSWLEFIGLLAVMLFGVFLCCSLTAWGANRR